MSKPAPIVMFSAFQPSSVGFGPPDKNRNGGKFVPLLGPDGQRRRFTIQTPPLVMPFGVSSYGDKEPDGEIQSYSIDVSFRDADARVNDFLAKMRELDAHMLESSVANSQAWFGKQKSKDVLEDNYRKLVKEDPTGKHAPIFKIKVPIVRDARTDEKRVSCTFYDENQAKISIDELANGMTLRFIIELDRVWFVNSMFGVSWRAAQAQVVSRPSSYNEFSMLDDSDEAVLGLGGADAGAGAAEADAAAELEELA